MKKDIYRTIAVVTGVFMLTVAIMLVMNYFQVRQVTPLETEVMTTLKSLNESNPDNADLQAQIRQLDLLSRKAYFVQEDHLKTGVILLLVMTAVFVFCLRGYYADVLHIAPKDIDIFDEWLVKSRSRKYVQWLTATLTIVALVAVVASNPQWLKSDKANEEETLVAEQSETPATEAVVAEATAPKTPAEAPAEDEETAAETTEEVAAEQTAEAAPAAPAAARVNHGMFRGNNSNGHSSARNIPTTWDFAGGGKIAWKHALTTKQGFSSPAVHNNRIFYTGGDEAGRELYCHDLTTGDLLWT
ncbi:MAG: dehydrogenase, partial [Alistipes sp.]|nr:dehydrogenase [Alistipes sp.]